MDEQDTPTRPDAIMFPMGHTIPGLDATQERRVAVMLWAEGVLGCRRVWVRPSDPVYISPDHADTINFPKGHPLEGQPRYTWDDRGDGVLYGTLVPEARPLATTR